MTDLRIRSATTDRTPTEIETEWVPLDRWFQELGSFPILAHPFRWTAWTWDVDGDRTPRSDILDLGDRYELRAEFPGIPKENIEVRVRGDTLRVSAQSSVGSKTTEGEYLLQERRAQSFERAFQLPGPIPAAALTARFENGVLTVSVPKPKAPADEKVPVA
jgi:HSP20 family protein